MHEHLSLTHDSNDFKPSGRLSEEELASESNGQYVAASSADSRYPGQDSIFCL